MQQLEGSRQPWARCRFRHTAYERLARAPTARRPGLVFMARRLRSTACGVFHSHFVSYIKCHLYQPILHTTLTSATSAFVKSRLHLSKGTSCPRLLIFNPTGIVAALGAIAQPLAVRASLSRRRAAMSLRLRVADAATPRSPDKLLRYPKAARSRGSRPGSTELREYILSSLTEYIIDLPISVDLPLKP